MNPSRLAKIRRLAEDVRGDPATRARAQEKITALRRSHPQLFEAERSKSRNVQPDPRVHGMRRSPAYAHYIFTDMTLWGETKSGNKTTHVYHKGVIYQIVLFQYRKAPTWGWMRLSNHEDTAFSGRFATLEEAHGDAWSNLMAL